MPDELTKLSIAQMVAGNVFGLLQQSDRHGLVIDRLVALSEAGNNLAGSQLELLAHTVASVNGEEKLLVEQVADGLPEAQWRMLSASGPMLITALLGGLDDAGAEALARLMAAWSETADREGGETGEFYSSALRMVYDAAALASAARKMNQATGL